MGLEDEFEDGPYEGHQLEDVIYDYPWYIYHLIMHEHVIFDEEAYELISKEGIA